MIFLEKILLNKDLKEINLKAIFINIYHRLDFQIEIYIRIDLF